MRVPLCLHYIVLLPIWHIMESMIKPYDANRTNIVLIYNLFINIQSLIGLYITICIRENAKAYFKAI